MLLCDRWQYSWAVAKVSALNMASKATPPDGRGCGKMKTFTLLVGVFVAVSGIGPLLSEAEACGGRTATIAINPKALAMKEARGPWALAPRCALGPRG